MLWSQTSQLWVRLLCGLVVLLMLTGCVLLYRWIDRASEADRFQEQETVNRVMEGLQRDFSITIDEVRNTFRSLPSSRNQAELETEAANFYEEWISGTPHSRILRTFSLTFIHQEKLQFRRFDTEKRRFETTTWPNSLEALNNLLDDRDEDSGAIPLFRSGMLVQPSQPILVTPLFGERVAQVTEDGRRISVGHRPHASENGQLPSSARRVGTQGTIRESRHRADRSPIGFCILSLDPEYLTAELLPTLVQRHFSSLLSRYTVFLVDEAQQKVLYRSNSSADPVSTSFSDAAVTLFPLARRFGSGLRFRRVGPRPFIPRAQTLEERRPPAEGIRRPGWRLMARHQTGSIAAEALRTRRRNLGGGLGILILLGGSLLTLVISTEKARSLANRQLEFVAGVSHELRTPLSVLQTAGFNLARNPPTPDRIVQYAETIQRESRRLTGMVEQILSYAGMQSGRNAYQFRPIQLEEVVVCALARMKPVFQEAGWNIEQEVQDGLPPVSGDAPSLLSSTNNILENALKYADSGKWLRLSIISVTKGGKNEIVLTVEDKGPGIHGRDLPHVFEPFYRGRNVSGSAVPGAGLGLSLLHRHVQAHRGSVSANNRPEGGACFTVRLPALRRSGTGNECKPFQAL